MPPPKERRIGELLDLVELGAHHIGRFPAELSGGQKQRVSSGRLRQSRT